MCLLLCIAVTFDIILLDAILSFAQSRQSGEGRSMGRHKTTIGDAIYMGYKNDVSFLIDNYMNLYEAQSTRNPNMPLRGLIYFG